MPAMTGWPPIRADAQHILSQHPDAPPEHTHTCKVCGDTYWGIKHPVSHRIRRFCSKQCYYKHNELNPGFQRYRTSLKGKAMRQKVSARYVQSELGQLRHEQRMLEAKQFARWRHIVYTLDPSQKPQSPWANCSTPDCHNIPTKKLAQSCSGCLRDALVANRPNTWRNAGKPCVECSKPLQRYQGKFCSDACSYRYSSRRKRELNPEKYRASRRIAKQRRRARERDAFIEDVDVTVLLQWQQGRCYHCDNKIRIDKQAPHPKSLTLDHLIPLALGGPHSYANTVASCWNCNCSIKGTRAIGEQLKLV